ncbi:MULTISPECIES: carbohydrate kinase family protein [unclassified Alishewanella]|uniref:carbohydrate kinase family protein n=1 Tax=unclassified Alishewanella TaxID=2628974 RepID=UPI00404107E2
MKVVCIGEMLIDFVCTDTNAGLVNGVNYVKKSGGAPANVAACIGKLGADVSLVAAVGNDPYGQYLTEEIKAYHVNTDFVSTLPMSTTFAFVSLADNGEREFAFNRGADEQLCLSDAAIEQLTDDAIVHLGSATALLGGELSASYLRLATAAKRKGNIICFDPNFRIGLWQNREEEFKAKCEHYFALADIVKVSDDELVLLSNETDMQKGCQYFHDLGVKIVLVTLGPKGCLISHLGQQTLVPAYEITAIDTTGAGDSFIGAVLFKMSQTAPGDHFYREQIADFVAFAGKVSGLVCATIGAMAALPTLAEVEAGTFIVKK